MLDCSRIVKLEAIAGSVIASKDGEFTGDAAEKVG
jgi:hypothetical protein